MAITKGLSRPPRNPPPRVPTPLFCQLVGAGQGGGVAPPCRMNESELEAFGNKKNVSREETKLMLHKYLIVSHRPFGNLRGLISQPSQRIPFLQIVSLHANSKIASKLSKLSK